MPHVQPRSEPKASPADIDPLLDEIAKEPGAVNLIGITGSDMEFDGEIGFMVANHADANEVVNRLTSLNYPTRLVGEDDGLHLDFVQDVPGGLRAAIARARAHHPTGVIRDVAVGVRAIPFRFMSDGENDTELDRRPGGKDPVDTDGSHANDREELPVQVFFIVPKLR
jgi:hypothetical protein